MVAPTLVQKTLTGITTWLNLTPHINPSFPVAGTG